MNNIVDQIFDQRAKNLPPEVLADIFARLAWIVADNGAEIGRVLRQWLDSDDYERIEVALHFNEFSLFSSREEMIRATDRISQRWPHLNAQCERVIGLWESVLSQLDSQNS